MSDSEVYASARRAVARVVGDLSDGSPCDFLRARTRKVPEHPELVKEFETWYAENRTPGRTWPEDRKVGVDDYVK